MADFEEASVAGFQHVYPDAGVAGCWFHYAQAHQNTRPERGVPGCNADVQSVQCLVRAYKVIGDKGVVNLLYFVNTL